MADVSYPDTNGHSKVRAVTGSRVLLFSESALKLI